MPYLSLKPSTPGTSSHVEYQTVGHFENMVYLAPDVRGDKLKTGSKSEYEAKSDTEITAEFRHQLQGLYDLTGELLDDGWIKDYWLVVTPIVCDSAPKPYKGPLERENFIVTPFNIEELDLIEKLIVPSGMACGELQQRPNPRQRQASGGSRLAVYVAVEINDEHAAFDKAKGKKPGDADYDRASRSLALSIADQATTYTKAPVRAFLTFGRTEEGTPRFVEQVTDGSVKTKTQGFSLAEGYARGVFRKLDSSKYSKFRVLSDMFASSGYEFGLYGLSKEELADSKARFTADPWIPIEYAQD